jgi:hypothetical protein
MKTYSSRSSFHVLQLAAATAVLAVALAGSARADAPASLGEATQTSVVQGVAIKVTPRPLASGAADWEFSVVLETHSGSLDDDLARSAVLTVGGRDLAPTAWNGAAAGGHHREGILKFPAPAERPTAVELRIRRAGESEPRVFRWDAASLR